MREAEHDWLDGLAEAVADGRELDWDAIESSAPDDGTRVSIRRLRAIAAIGQAHADLTFSGETSESPSARSLLPGVDDSSAPTQWGSLRIIERVGRGRFGDVYRAWEPSLDREVALKLLRRRDIDASSDLAVIEEGRLMARVRHPNVITIYGAQRIDGRTGLWMEFVEGRTLEADLKERGFFPANEVAQVGIELCRALAAVHRAGLVHRDVKAQNVMRDRSGRIVLGDFGTGREFPETIRASELEIVGTPAYLAPEVLRGEPATRQSDVYSLGVLLFHLATGTYPVTGRSISEIRAAHDRGDRVSFAAARQDLSASLISTIERALHPDWESRFDDAEALRTALEACDAVEALESWPTRFRVRAAGIAAMVIVAIGAAVASALWPEEPQPAGSSRDESAPASIVVPAPAPAVAEARASHRKDTPSSSDDDVPAAPSMALPTSSESSPGIASPELSPIELNLLLQSIEEYMRSGETAVARRYAATVPRPADPDAVRGTGGKYWRLVFQARASWQELNAQDSLEAVEAIAGLPDFPPVTLPWLYAALGRLKQAERLAAALPPNTERTGNPASREAMLTFVLQHSADRARLKELLVTPPLSSVLGDNLGLLIRAGLLDRAEEVMGKMRQVTGKSSGFPLAEAHIMLLRGEPARAIEMLKDAVRKPTPEQFQFVGGNTSLGRVRALAWDALGHPERGIEALREVDVERHVLGMGTAVPDWFEHRALLARLYRAAGREREARPIEEELRKLLAVADDDHPIVRQLAMAPE